MKRFVSGHYLANEVLLASYGLMRWYCMVTPPEDRLRTQIKTPDALLHWETQAAFALIVIVLFKLWRRRSWDHAAAQIMLYAKAVLAMMAFLIDIRLLAWYLMAFWAIYALFPQPLIDLFQSGSVDSLTPTTLKEASLATDTTWMVFFYTTAHSNSVAAAPAFLEIANEFSSPKLCFGAFDICAWPQTAAEMRLSCNTWSNQLPSVMMFQKGKEWGRLPPASAANDPGKTNYYTRADIVRLFKLEEFSKPLDVANASKNK